VRGLVSGLLSRLLPWTRSAPSTCPPSCSVFFFFGCSFPSLILFFALLDTHTCTHAHTHVVSFFPFILRHWTDLLRSRSAWTKQHNEEGEEVVEAIELKETVVVAEGDQPETAIQETAIQETVEEQSTDSEAATAS